LTFATTQQKTSLGAIWALFAVMCFSVNDVTIKFLSGDYALHQIVLIRSFVGMAVLLAVIMPLEGGYHLIKTRRLGLHIIRGLCVVFANMTFFLGLSVLPLADAVAVFFISPMIITTLSVLVLKEKVGLFRWGAVIVGMLGVLVMFRPGGESFRLALLLPFAAAFGYAFLHILTRFIGGTERASTMAFYIQFVFIIVSGLIGLMLGDGKFAGGDEPMLEFLFRSWVWPAVSDYPLLGLIGATSAMGGYFISQAYRLSEASLIAPMEYGALVAAIFFGVVVFGEWPDFVSWFGIVLIAGAGLCVIWRESVLNKRQRAALPRSKH
jgi:drug/metabolite transporter (DMT)-like permease